MSVDAVHFLCLVSANCLVPYPASEGLTVMLREINGKMLKERDIQSVEPDHIVGPLIAMIVPIPGRRNDKVSRLHEHLLARDRRVA